LNYNYNLLFKKIKEIKMKIDIRSKNSLYIELNGWTYYIDDSTKEQIINKWHKDMDEDTAIDCTDGVLIEG
tara:strand:- start:792 stop:1004 length:213 start_codon:yes stop_codon:yes gene_type:complete